MWVRDNKKSIKQLIDENGIKVEKFARFKVGQG
jgi:translation elongation factor EF-Ts